MTTLKLSNLNKPSDPKWQKIGDIALFAIPIYIPIVMGLPINDLLKSWIMAGLSFVLGTVKIISKFTLDSDYIEPIAKATPESNKD